MSTIGSITDLMNETALQQARDAQAAREASYKDENSRNTSGSLGKNDFLMLLSAQLRYQDPLEPVKDSEFAAQLAQFSALEQMQNMNMTLSAMSSYQAYGLVGKFAVATTYVDGVLTEVPGIIDCVFTEKGVTFAQIGSYAVPVSSITEVYDNSSMLTPKMLLEASNNLIGRTVKGSADGKIVEGTVTRLSVDNGVMYAFIDDGSETAKVIRVETIYDIRQAGTPGDVPAPKDTEEETPLVPKDTEEE
ncbi:MAG: hypothetical protein FWH33_07265 [Oscillospiraceae bacterium]|nr:hypothetical protein [Oscillospiraceae bacterium]